LIQFVTLHFITLPQILLFPGGLWVDGTTCSSLGQTRLTASKASTELKCTRRYLHFFPNGHI